MYMKSEQFVKIIFNDKMLFDLKCGIYRYGSRNKSNAYFKKSVSIVDFGVAGIPGGDSIRQLILDDIELIQSKILYDSPTICWDA